MTAEPGPGQGRITGVASHRRRGRRRRPRAPPRILRFQHFATAIPGAPTSPRSRTFLTGANRPASARSARCGRCTSPPGSSSRAKLIRRPPPNSGSPPSAICSTGWSTARSCRLIRPPRCAAPGTWCGRARPRCWSRRKRASCSTASIPACPSGSANRALR
jgi:hypothetical protein